MRIGLTGGVGSGKSTVADLLAGHGAVIVDADQIARDIVEPGGPALAELVTEFGPRILREDGSLNRGELAALAFSDSRATQRLNEIMHPLIAAESRRRMQAAGDTPVVVYDMPLLVETGQQDLVDLVVVVDVPEEVQVARAVGLRGMDETDVRRRIEAQASREERLAAADVVIDNSGELAVTREQVEALWRRALASAASRNVDG
ncbi:MAG: dephospho-CoA kinase [Actinomycetota bacterium]|nr:dephospho-CoA kinase [Actinomycetota bacterium]